MKIKLVKTKNPKKVPKILRKKSTEVEQLTPEILDLIEKMKKIMNENKGVGISAVQVGIPLRIMIVKDCDREKDLIFINPQIIKLSKNEIPFREGCLSFPGYYAVIIRPEKAKIVAKNEKWEDIEIESGGLIGRAFQHEIDHMNGIVFIDHVKDLNDLEKITNQKF